MTVLLDSSVLVAARRAKADIFYTINLSDFLHLHREGDPEIRRP